MRQGIEDSDEEVKKRGRKRVEEKWTRVMAIVQDPLKRVQLPTVAADLKLASATLNQSRAAADADWTPHFHPKTFVKEHPRMKLEDFNIAADQLETYGKQLTTIRKALREKAQEIQR